MNNKTIQMMFLNYVYGTQDLLREQSVELLLTQGFLQRRKNQIIGIYVGEVRNLWIFMKLLARDKCVIKYQDLMQWGEKICWQNLC